MAKKQDFLKELLNQVSNPNPLRSHLMFENFE